MKNIYDQIFLNDLEVRLRNEGGFKNLIQNFKWNNVDGAEEIKAYFYVLKYVINSNFVSNIIEKILTEIIINQGN